MSAYLLSVIGALVAIVFILEMLRRGRLREKYAVLWLCVGVVVLVLGIAPSVLTSAADLLGVVVPANLLFFVSGLALLLISLQQSSEISRLEEETRTLAEEVALLRLAQESLQEVLAQGRRGPSHEPARQDGSRRPDTAPRPAGDVGGTSA